jgi:hypothetical protein
METANPSVAISAIAASPLLITAIQASFSFPSVVSTGMFPRKVNYMLLFASMAVAEQRRRRHGSPSVAG